MPQTTIRFLRSWSSYNAGECAAFSGHVAAKMVETGVAELVRAPASPPARKTSVLTAKHTVKK